jgi:hypothetical protein
VKLPRSIFDLRPAKPAKLDDLGAFVQMFGVASMLKSRDPVVNKARVDRAVAQFIAVRACLRMPL